jgi:hypothetical protein
MPTYACLHVSRIPQTENGNLRSFAAKGKWQTSIFLLQMEVDFPWKGND